LNGLKNFSRLLEIFFLLSLICAKEQLTKNGRE
jgi:hypothetical protein